MKQPRKKTIWLSLRLFLFVCLFLGMAVGWTYNRAQTQARAIEQLVESGFTLAYDQDSVYTGWVNCGFGGSLPTKEMPDGEMADSPPDNWWLKKLRLERLGGSIKFARAERHYGEKEKFPGLTDSDVAPIGLLRGLRYLEVSNSSITDDGMKAFAGLSSLETLNLSGNEFTDQGLKYLEQLKNLKVLLLSDNRITDAGLESIGKLTNLETLHLNGTEITGKGLEQIAGLSQLQDLGLSRTMIASDKLSLLSNFPELEELSISGTQVNDEAIEWIGGLSKLTGLYADGTDIGDKFIAGLSSDSLNSLSIEETKVTGKSLKKIMTWPLEYFSAFDSGLDDSEQFIVSDAIDERKDRR